MSDHPAKFGGDKHCDSEDVSFSLSYDLKKPRDQRVL